MVSRLLAVMGLCGVLFFVPACSEAPLESGQAELEGPGEVGEEGLVAEDFVISLDGQKLTPEHLKWMNRRNPGQVPDQRTAADLANYWLEIQLLYEESMSRGITNQPGAEFVADFVAKESYVRRLVRQVREEAKVTDEQVLDYYEKNKATDRMLREPARFSFSRVESKDLAASEAAFARISGGENINDVAREISTGRDAEKGGQVKQVTAEYVQRRYGKELLDAFEAGSQGDIVGPIKLASGSYAVVRLDEKTESRALAFDDIKEALRSRLNGKIQREAVRDLIDSIKASAADRIVKSQYLLDGEKLPRPRPSGGRGQRPQ